MNLIRASSSRSLGVAAKLSEYIDNYTKATGHKPDKRTLNALSNKAWGTRAKRKQQKTQTQQSVKNSFVLSLKNSTETRPLSLMIWRLITLML